MGVGVVGLAENKANSAQLELELGLSLAKSFSVGSINTINTILFISCSSVKVCKTNYDKDEMMLQLAIQLSILYYLAM